MEYIEREIGHPVLWERHCRAQYEMIAVADCDITAVLENLALASKLIDEGVPHTVAAMQVGYDNYSNFCRLYHKHFGKRPEKKE